MTPAELIARIRQDAQLNDLDEDWTDAELLTEASQALEDNYPQHIVTLRAGYWLQRSNTTTVAGQSYYQIPARAVANGLEKLEISIDGGITFYQLVILTDIQATDYIDTQRQGQVTRFSLQADSVVLYPVPSVAQILRFSYYLSPPKLTAAQSGGIVTAVTSGTTPTLTISGGLPAALTAPGILDCIHTTGSGELSLVSVAFTYSNPTVTLAAGTDVSRVAVSDVIRLAEQSDYIPLPKNLHRSLADYVAAVVLAAKGDTEKAGIWASKSDKSVQRFVDLGQPRVKGAPPRFITRNTYLRSRSGFNSGRNWR